MIADALLFCPRCGSRLERTCLEGGRERSCCPTCGFVVFHNPVPAVTTAVIDGDRALFVERARPPEKGCWSMPGGYLEVDERPEEGAARELAEETGLEVDPSDLEFVGASYEPGDGARAVMDVVFAVSRRKTEGEPVADDDAAEVAFWPREEIADDPDHLRAGDVSPILRAIDALGDGGSDPEIVLW